MTQNTLPSGIHDLMQLAETMAQGLEIHGPWLQMMQTKPSEFREALESLRESETAFASLRSAKTAARKSMNAADGAVTEWLAKARLALLLACGVQWSEAWIDAGFTHRATNVPKATVPRIELARRVIDFFARNPEFGVAHANITATYGRRLYDGAIGAGQVRRQVTTECLNAKNVRDAAERQLRRKMRQVVLILSDSIKSNDPRWHDFGLDQPRTRGSKTKRLAAAPAASITVLPPHPAAVTVAGGVAA